LPEVLTSRGEEKGDVPPEILDAYAAAVKANETLYPHRPVHGAAALKRLQAYLDDAVLQYKDWNYRELNVDHKRDPKSLVGYDEILSFRYYLNKLIQEERKKGEIPLYSLTRRFTRIRAKKLVHQIARMINSNSAA